MQQVAPPVLVNESSLSPSPVRVTKIEKPPKVNKDLQQKIKQKKQVIQKTREEYLNRRA